MKNVLPGLFVLLLTVHLAGPALAAAWAVPGAACTQEGANANSNGFLTCTGGVWVSNAVLLGTTSATCDSSNAGYIRYNGGSFEGCNGLSWIQLASSGGYKVYQADGTTLVGNLIGPLTNNCNNLVYSDVSGNISYLNGIDCSGLAAHSLHFTGANCTGTAYALAANHYGWACTGSANCQTNLSIGTNPVAVVTIASYRSAGGDCAVNNTSGSYYPVTSYTAKCGGTGPCLVK